PPPAPITPSSLTDLCNLIGTALMLIMLLCYPTTAGSWSERLRYLLDAATVAVGTGVTMWFLLEPSGTDAGGDPFRLLGAAVLAMSGFAVTKLTLTGALAIRAP